LGPDLTHQRHWLTLSSSFRNRLFVLVWFSDYRRLAVIVRFVVVLLLLLVIIVVIVGVSRRHHIADEAQQAENTLGDERGHVGLPLDITTFTGQMLPREDGKCDQELGSRGALALSSCWP
jgi:hypothetical protein